MFRALFPLVNLWQWPMLSPATSIQAHTHINPHQHLAKCKSRATKSVFLSSCLPPEDLVSFFFSFFADLVWPTIFCIQYSVCTAEYIMVGTLATLVPWPFPILILYHVNSLPADQLHAIGTLAALMDVINQTVGDAISDLLVVETVLHAKGWSIQDWEETYTDLPNRQLKVVVKVGIKT